MCTHGESDFLNCWLMHTIATFRKKTFVPNFISTSTVTRSDDLCVRVHDIMLNDSDLLFLRVKVPDDLGNIVL